MNTLPIYTNQEGLTEERRLAYALSLSERAIAELTDAGHDRPESEAEALVQAAVQGLLADVHLEDIRHSVTTMLAVENELVRA